MLAGYKKLDVPSISDTMDKFKIFGALYQNKAVVTDTFLCGQAFTVHYMPDEILPGEVAVLDNNGRDDCTAWGDIMSIYASQYGITGTVIDRVFVNPGDFVYEDNTGVVVPFEKVEREILAKVRVGMPLKKARKQTSYHILQTSEK